jgi:hypothetical protein
VREPIGMWFEACGLYCIVIMWGTWECEFTSKKRAV